MKAYLWKILGLLFFCGMTDNLVDTKIRMSTVTKCDRSTGS